jgi:hypothetical protein
MKKDYYVTLTGGKSNAGDFLIKYRAFDLFKNLRPDRYIIDFNEWEKIDDSKLEIINKSKALILLGGPGIVKNMYPDIYPLRENLDDIKVPIIMMGLGWKNLPGKWEDTYKIRFSKNTKYLLDKIDQNGYFSSVRDYHTLNLLQLNGYKNILMTGCPAYYELDYINKEFVPPKKISKIAFSLGVSFVNSLSMEKQMKNVILFLKDYFENSIFEVVFHHPVKIEKLKKIYEKNYAIGSFYKKHKKFIEWLESHNINYVDISGSAENLINYYLTVDLHIGYRVHAHIFMNSINKLSILISEDGRGKAVKDVIGGIVLNGYLDFKLSFVFKILYKLINIDRYKVNYYLLDELIHHLEYEYIIDFQRIKNSRKQIDGNFNIMKKFIRQLP